MAPETGGQFSLGQNYPNLHHGQTMIPFLLVNPAQVCLEVWDLSGRKMDVLEQGWL